MLKCILDTNIYITNVLIEGVGIYVRVCLYVLRVLTSNKQFNPLQHIYNQTYTSINMYDYKFKYIFMY